MAKEANALYLKHDDIHFLHIEKMSLAMITLLESNGNFSVAKKHLQPIYDYLEKIDKWKLYELFLITNCFFIFEIDTALRLGERALKVIESDYTSFIKSPKIETSLAINLAIYCLDYEEHHYLALKHAQTTANWAVTNRLGNENLHAKIIQQVAHYKLENGQYNKELLLSLINCFQLQDLDAEYNQMQTFLQKHGISLA